MTDTDDPRAPPRHARAFPDLAPPPGGLVRLRERLDARDRRTARLLAFTFVPALAAAAAVVFLVVTRAPAGDDDTAADGSRFRDHPSLHVSAPSPGLAVPLSEQATLYWVP